MKKLCVIVALMSFLVASLTIVGRFAVEDAVGQDAAAGAPANATAPAAAASAAPAIVGHPTVEELEAATEQSSVEPLEGYKDGLWREGMAVFSDWIWLDFLMKPADRRGYRPTQPINYSHQLHVEKNQMECTYCHSGVAKSANATLPSTELCMGCHKTVSAAAIKQKYNRESPDLQKLESYFKEGRPIPWNPVHNLPEHAHFSHKRHIKAGFGCQNCHGQIQKMPVVERVSSLKMGFCVSCHRENGASIDCSTCHY